MCGEKKQTEYTCVYMGRCLLKMLRKELLKLLFKEAIRQSALIYLDMGNGIMKMRVVIYGTEYMTLP